MEDSGPMELDEFVIPNTNTDNNPDLEMVGSSIPKTSNFTEKTKPQ